MTTSDTSPDKDFTPVNLPATQFPMRASLNALEPRLIERWASINIWKQIRTVAAGRPAFILHDGPPFANGNIHLGTALNKILKDIVNRSQHMLGHDANYIPGWDCHGLPIEWKVEEQHRKRGVEKQSVPISAFRQECRQFANRWVEVQKEEFKRLGVLADWTKPYLTMAHESEAKIARELTTFIKKGAIYRSLRPVLWSVVEQTALAEAEIEYKTVRSKAIYVAFPINPEHPRFGDCKIVIWTTTPWTIPANRVLACHHELQYVSVTIREVDEQSSSRPGMRIIVAESLLEAFTKACRILSWEIDDRFSGKDLEGTQARHPLYQWNEGYDFPIPVAMAEFVDSNHGTGIVHIAPSHGPDDFELGRRLGIDPVPTVAKDGTYTKHVPGFTGKTVYGPDGKTGTANDSVIEALDSSGNLLGLQSYRHDYPHSWRSKTPLIFRLTRQWFVALDKQPSLRDQALKALEKVRFFPASGRERLTSMVRFRPDWCISRQRCWGVPLPLFVHRETKAILDDRDVFDRIVSRFEKDGADAWFNEDPQFFLGPAYNVKDYEQIFDVVDVWFDSGSTHAFVLENQPGLTWPADLYLEGSDQHRGWFQSSLLQAVGTRGKAPYKAIMTHGFVVDPKGQKLSKSLGNYLSMDQLLKQHGAELLRLWIANADVFSDIRFSDDIMKQQRDVYRRIRNTLRWMLGILHDQPATNEPEITNLPALERLVLHRLSGLSDSCHSYVRSFRFNQYMRLLFNFCNDDLSAFYFDIRKDLLYCGAKDDPKRKASLAVLGILFDRLCKLCAPVLCFTAEEAWMAMHGDDTTVSVHTTTYADTPWHDPAIEPYFEPALQIRRSALQCLDRARKEGLLRSSLEATVNAYTSRPLAFSETDLAELCIVSKVSIKNEAPPEGCTGNENYGVQISLADGNKCPRCWRVLEEISRAGHICGRCASV